mmetsp:Transcript_6557/g.9553  ORF Transcript_6557/g.9553 Transcript_6557/m.9553 type:complete len:647 (-) Transcript_6557:319-2259(-)
MSTNFPSHWCDATSATLTLHHTAKSFLEALNLPSIHPLCNDDGKTFNFSNPSVPLDSEMTVFESDLRSTPLESMVTIYWQVAPALLAISELWLRLFAFLVAPICVSFLIMGNIAELTSNLAGLQGKHEKVNNRRNRFFVTAASILGLASSTVLLTDSLYVFEYGRSYGLMLFLSMLVLSVRSCWAQNSKRVIYFVLLPIVIATILLCLDSSATAGSPSFYSSWLTDGGNKDEVSVNAGANFTSKMAKGFDRSKIDIPSILPGFYFSSSNQFIQSIASEWSEESRLYDASENGDATPWLVTGDSRTGIPFLINSVESQIYTRVWLSSELVGKEEESVAMDIAFPPDGIHRTDKPLYLVLHGLNGGSSEEYIKEFVQRRINEGSTVAVMIARGLMNTPVVGWNVFNGARVSDVDASAKALKFAIPPGQILAGAGYSMGAIIIANYVARSGANCYLDAAVSVSGGLDMREMLTFKRSMRLWQPVLAKELRETVLGQFRARYEKRLTSEQYLALMRSTSVSSIDINAVVNYNGFDDIFHYYSEMSAMGDMVRLDGTKEEVGRIANVSIPFLVVHALDDPLCTWRTMGPNPQQLIQTGSGNVMMLLTKTGGHVGWPLGTNPKLDGWKWMNNVVGSFVDSVDRVIKKEENVP